MRMAVGGVRVDMHVAGMGCRGLLVAVPPLVLFHWPRLAEVGSSVVAGGKRVHHHRPDGRRHGHEAGDREVLPWILLQAGRCQALEGGREDVNQPGRKYDAGRKGFNDEEYIVLRSESGDRPPKDRDEDSNGTCR